MSKARRTMTRVPVMVIPIAAIAMLLAGRALSQQPKSGQKYQDKWVKVPFCGSVTITKQGDGKASSLGSTWEKKESGKLTANISGPKEKTGEGAGFFLEGSVNMTYTYHEVHTSSGVKPSVWDMQATGQKQHTYEPGAYEWTALHVNRARGLYRFHPPYGEAKGTMTYTIGDGPTRQQAAYFDEWSKTCGFVDDIERSFDPEKGIITESVDFTFFNLLGIKDFFGRESPWPDPDHRPPADPPKNELPGGLDPAEKIWESYKLLKEKHPDLVQPVTYTVTWNLNLDTGACRHTVRIIDPKENEEVYFGDPKTLPGTLNITGHAEADPKSYGPHIYPWDIDDIKGSTKEIKKLSSDCQSEYDSTPVEGECVRFRFRKLPRDNAQFGMKTITADTAEPVHIKVFFRRSGRDGPIDFVPNWYYYWKQGAVPDLDKFMYSDHPRDPKVKAAFIRPDSLYVYPGAALCREPKIIELFERLPGFVNPGNEEFPPYGGGKKLRSMKEDMLIRVFRTLYVPEIKGVDLCHALVLHELKHKWVFDTFHDAIDGGQLDSDGDELPDSWEIWMQPIYQFDPMESDTHFLRLQVSGDYRGYGDQELLAREAELGRAAVHELDWARPGKQSEDKDECNAKK